jgi:hypothetical protein
MLLAIVLATTPPSPHAVSLSGSAGMALWSDDEPESHDASLSAGYVAGTRLQYDRSYQGWFVGAVGGYEHVSSDSNPPTAHVLLLGATAGGRWGETIRGGLRLAGGFAYGMTLQDYYVSEPPPSIARATRYDLRINTPGWFLDIEGELSTRVDKHWEVFLDVPIIVGRNFVYQGEWAHWGEWGYVVPIIPLMATVGLRRFF